MVEATSAYGRGCLRGVARYARAHGGWHFYHHARYMTEPMAISDLRAWKADGVIARIENKEVASTIRALKLPTVDLRGTIDVPGAILIQTDDRAVIEMAGEHLVSNGLKHLAFCGYPGIDFSDSREKEFLNYKPAQTLDKHLFHPTLPQRKRPAVKKLSYEQRGVEDWSALQEWLKELPKPVGVICCNDTRGRQVLEACAAADIKVPYDVSVVGVDDDDVMCELSYPTMTSVAPNVETIGFDAAKILDGVLSGQPAPAAPIYYPPVTIEVRGSSDMTALSDPTLIQAVRLIRTKVGEGINVKQLLAEVPVSRSTFERQFREFLGCTPYEYILRCRIDKVKQLLVNTNYPVSKITRMAGFRGVAHMAAVFRQRTGQTPSQFRHASL
jgi:LacI family transcriptional regulator